MWLWVLHNLFSHHTEKAKTLFPGINVSACFGKYFLRQPLAPNLLRRNISETKNAFGCGGG